MREIRSAVLVPGRVETEEPTEARLGDPGPVFAWGRNAHVVGPEKPAWWNV